MVEKIIPPKGRNRDQLILVFCSVTLFAVVCIVFGSSMDYTFFADDSCEVLSLNQSFSRGALGVAKRLISPWQTENSQLFYRPLSELSFILNFYTSGTDPRTYHFTNVMIHACVTIATFFLSRKLYKEIGSNSVLPAFFAALIFSLFPVNAEVVNWLVGRVDSLSTLFYTLALLVLVYDKDREPTSFRSGRLWALIFFLLALMSKETAVTFPVIMFAFEFCIVHKKSSMRENLILSLRAVFPFLVLLLLFIIVRSCVLGNLIGGYVGSLGEAYSLHPFGAVLSNGHLTKLFLAYNESVLTPDHILVIALRLVIFILAISCIIISIMTKTSDEQWRVMKFAIVWFLVNLLFVLPYAYLQPTLAGGRFFYMPTVPFVIGASAYFFCGRKPGFVSGARPFTLSVLVALICLCLVYGLIQRGISEAWHEASVQANSLRTSIRNIHSNRPDKRIVVVNAPDHYKGAHMFHSDGMLSCFLDLDAFSGSSNIETLQRDYHTELLNRSLLRKLCLREGCDAYMWNQREKKMFRLSSLNHLLSDANPPGARSLILNKVNTGDKKSVVETYISQAADIPSEISQFEFVAFSASCPTGAVGLPLPATLRWEDERSMSFSPHNEVSIRLVPDGRIRDYVFSVGDIKSWCLTSNLSSVSLTVPHGLIAKDSIEARLFSRLSLVPSLEIKDSHSPQSKLLNTQELNFDVSNIPTACGALLEVSKPNSSFQDYSGTFRETRLSKRSLASIQYHEVRGIISLSPLRLPLAKAAYQMRLFALNQKGEIVGYCSDPVHITMN